MSSAYDQLLTAAIEHLESLKARGVRHVPLDPASLALLLPASAKKAKAAKPSPAPPLQAGPRPSVPKPQPPVPPRREAVCPPVAAPVPVPAAAPVIPLSEVPPMERAAKEGAMKELRERALVCQKCPHLVRSRTNVVFGVGDMHSPLMFVGEAPGADEDVQGEPFVGKAGQLLTRIIQTMGLSRETVYIANILKCRPDTPGQTSGNRKPTPEEMKTCLPYLLAQVDIIRPKVIVALGATAVEGLLGRAVSITKLRGQWQEFRGTPLMPTYHPSYLLRNQTLALKREVWEDMLQVMERLSMPISAKQRGFFLKA